MHLIPSGTNYFPDTHGPTPNPPNPDNSRTKCPTANSMEAIDQAQLIQKKILRTAQTCCIFLSAWMSRVHRIVSFAYQLLRNTIFTKIKKADTQVSAF